MSGQRTDNENSSVCSEDDYKIKGRLPDNANIGTMMRGAMDYRPSTYDTAPQNRSFYSPGYGSVSDDVFGENCPMQSTPKTPQCGRGASQYTGSPIQPDEGISGTYGRSPAFKYPVRSPGWEDNSRAGERRLESTDYGEMSGYLGVAESVFRNPKLLDSIDSCTDSPSPSYNANPKPPCETLPSSPETPNDNRFRNQPSIDRCDADMPPFDFQNRHTLPIRRTRDKPLGSSNVSGQPQTGATIKWEVDASGKPSLAIPSLGAPENMNQVEDLTGDRYNKFVKQKHLSPVMFTNSGLKKKEAVAELAKESIIKVGVQVIITDQTLDELHERHQQNTLDNLWASFYQQH